jgi:CRISPR-associated protein Cas2
MEGYGSRVQYSVFISDLSARELVLMRRDLMTIMNQSEESVMIIDLGQPEDKSRFQFLGVRERLPARAL